MPTLCKKTLILLLTLICVNCFANAEQDALLMCVKFNKALAHSKRLGQRVDCQQNQHSAAQWQCMIDYYLSMRHREVDAKRICFQQAPALNAYQKYTQALQNTKPEVVCAAAMMIFEKYHPNDKAIKLLSSSCHRTEHSAIEWMCMKDYAKAKNSFHFAGGQCFLAAAAGPAT